MKTTKMWALLVLALFVASLAPFAAAQGGSGQGAGASAEAGAGAQAQAAEQAGAGVETREEKLAKIQQIKSELMQKRVQVRAEIEGVRNAFQERYQQNKEQRKEMRQERKDLHKQWKEKRTELKQEREQVRAELGETKGKLAQCRGSDSADCQQTRKKAKVQAGKFLTKASEHIIAVIEKAKERVQSSALSDEAKATLIADLEADIAEFDAAEEASAALDETATKEDLKAAAGTIKQLWGKAKEDIRTAMGAVVSNRVGGIVVKMEKLADKFDRVIAKLEAKGKDVGALKTKQADYQTMLGSAKSLQEEAKVLIAAGDRAGANEKIKAAHQELKAANELLRGIVQEIRGAGGAEELESEPAESNEAGAAA